LHELTHWTGHADRKARTFGNRFGDDAYAFEELVAELGAAFLGGHVGIVDATLENHASYLDNWLSVLKRDKGAIFCASRHATEAFDFILNPKVANAREQAV
jgi:antirestriction protein ArdC